MEFGFYFKCNGSHWKVLASLVAQMVKKKKKKSACNAGDPGSISGSRREDCLEKQMASTVFLPGDFHGQRSLVGYSLLGCKEMDMTE